MTTAAKPRWVGAHTGAGGTQLEPDTGEPERVAPSSSATGCGLVEQLPDSTDNVVDWQATQILTSARSHLVRAGAAVGPAPAFAAPISSGEDRK